MSNPSAQEPKPFCFGVSLFIKGDNLDLEIISRTLGLKPTSISRKGEQYGHARTVCEFDGWYYSPGIDGKRPLEEHIVALWDAVRPHMGYLRDLKKQFDVSISAHVMCCSLWFGKEYHTGFDFDCRCMGLLAELGLPCRVFVTITERLKS